MYRTAWAASLVCQQGRLEKPMGPIQEVLVQQMSQLPFHQLSWSLPAALPCEKCVSLPMPFSTVLAATVLTASVTVFHRQAGQCHGGGSGQQDPAAAV